ncbi:MAG: sulfite exporter TauE/SafE family protein [Candidatus Saccharibacteria bacterium]|jgi:hypothetical protein|nr:sulfite exporter TauE/SafE family protein [Candidatus Saccharibacteria bacterium]
MSDLLCIATIVLAGIVQASLQLSLGGLILLYHASMGHHRRRKTRSLTRHYILGAGVISFLMVCALAFMISSLFNGALKTEYLIICVGVFLASALVMWLFYYRRGRNTELWLPRSFTRFIQRRAKTTNDNIESFSLGMLSSFAEMPLSIALYFVVANCILNLSAQYQIIAVIGYTIMSIIPLLVLKLRVRTGQNVVEVQKWRVRNKAFARIISGSGFLVLAAFVLTYWVM